MIRHRLNVHFKGQKGTVIPRNNARDDEQQLEVVDDEECSDENETEDTHFVTITTKNEAGEDQDQDDPQQTMHQLVFISETEAILV